MPLLSSLPVGSLLIYPTAGSSPASKTVHRIIRYGVKQARPAVIQHSIKRLRDTLPGSPLEGFWQDPGLLVPVPSRAPRVKGGLWVAQRICDELIRQGVAGETAELLERATPVPPSSGQTKGRLRPTPKTHYESLRVTDASLFGVPVRITLVDDVVTRGSTLIGCASRLQDAYPGVEINAFALARTDNNTDLADTYAMVDPRLGRIHFQAATGRLVHKW